MLRSVPCGSYFPLFASLYASGVLRLFAVLCFSINTIGAIGDLWIVTKLLRHGAGTWVQDTKSGIQVWDAPNHDE